MSRTLSYEEARAFYDRFGPRQDLQRCYENRAIEALLDHSGLEEAGSIVEFGCGTAAMAEELLRRRLPPGSTYLGFDVSSTMLKLARERTAPWVRRARVELTTGSPSLPIRDGSCSEWGVRHREVRCALGICTEIVVATRW